MRFQEIFVLSGNLLIIVRKQGEIGLFKLLFSNLNPLIMKIIKDILYKLAKFK